MICHIGRYLHLHFHFQSKDNTMQIIQCKNKDTLGEIAPPIVVDVQINFVTIFFWYMVLNVCYIV